VTGLDFFVLIFVVIGAVHFGWNLREIYAKHVLKKMNEELSEDLAEIQQQFKDNVIPMRVEKHQSEYYLYNTTNQSFICQGKNKGELQDKFNTVYPKKKGVILEGGEIWRELNDE
jgi:hypothetical protein